MRWRLDQAHTALGYRIDTQTQGQDTQRNLRISARHLQDHAGTQQYAGDTGREDEHHETSLQPSLAQMAQGRTDTEGYRGDLVRRQGDTKRQPKENQHRQLQQPGTTAGKRGEQVGNQGNQKKYELFHDSAANPRLGVIIMTGQMPAGDQL